MGNLAAALAGTLRNRARSDQNHTQHGMVDSDFTESTEISQTSPALAVSFEHFPTAACDRDGEYGGNQRRKSNNEQKGMVK
jgi:hypothetical protein